jgi:hypothetical protein
MFATLQGGDSVLYMRNGIEFNRGKGDTVEDRRMGTNWIKTTVDMGENIAQVSCGYRGYVWAVSESGKVYRLDGVDAKSPEGTGWTFMNRSGMSHVSIGDEGQVWANDLNGNVFHVGNNDNQSWTDVQFTMSTNFAQVDGNLVQLDVGTDRVVGVNNWGEIFFRELAGSATG